MTAARSTLVIHPGALGDVLQAVPALRAIRRDGPVTFAGQPRLGRLLQEVGVVDTALSFDGLGLEALFTEVPVGVSLSMRLAGVDRVISWFGVRDEGYTRRLRSITGDALIAAPVPSDAALTVWRHLLMTLGATSPPERSPLNVPAGWRSEARLVATAIGAEGTRAPLVVHPGAGGAWKLWPAENLARVIGNIARRFSVQLLIHQGPADQDAADRLLRALDVPALRLIEPELPVLAGVLSEAAAYLGGDSGVSQLAAAVGARAVIVYPAATRERWAPWSASAHVLTMSEDRDLIERVTAALSERIGAAATSGT